MATGQLNAGNAKCGKRSYPDTLIAKVWVTHDVITALGYCKRGDGLHTMIANRCHLGVMTVTYILRTYPRPSYSKK
jgi:hypothetical protein